MCWPTIPKHRSVLKYGWHIWYHCIKENWFSFSQELSTANALWVGMGLCATSPPSPCWDFAWLECTCLTHVFTGSGNLSPWSYPLLLYHNLFASSQSLIRHFFLTRHQRAWNLWGALKNWNWISDHTKGHKQSQAKGANLVHCWQGWWGRAFMGSVMWDCGEI